MELSMADQVARIREHTDLPIAVGFGISSRDMVKQVHETADAAVVGSAIVKKVEDNLDAPDLAEKVAAYVASLLPEDAINK